MLHNQILTAESLTVQQSGVK